MPKQETLRLISNIGSKYDMFYYFCSAQNKIANILTSKGVLESVEKVVAIKRTSGTNFPGETSLVGSVIPANLETIVTTKPPQD